MAGIVKKSFESPDESRAYVIEPGHDASVVGNEPWVAFEFESKTAEVYGAS